MVLNDGEGWWGLNSNILGGEKTCLKLTHNYHHIILIHSILLFMALSLLTKRQKDVLLFFFFKKVKETPKFKKMRGG